MKNIFKMIGKIAATDNKTAVLKRLLAAGADIRLKCRDQLTAIDHAALNNARDAVTRNVFCNVVLMFATEMVENILFQFQLIT